MWISYFQEGSTVPPPFNVIPTPKSFFRYFFCQTKKKKKFTQAQKEDAEDRYLGYGDLELTHDNKDARTDNGAILYFIDEL